MVPAHKVPRVVHPNLHPTLADWVELVRPFSFTASIVPVLVGAAAAWAVHRGHIPGLFIVLLSVMLLQAGTNVVNEVFDVARGVDTPQTPRASSVVLTGRVPPRLAHEVGLALLLLGTAAGAFICAAFGLGWGPLLIGLAGAAAGYAYTAPPLQLKYHGLAVPAVALLMGPLVVLGTEYVLAGRWTWTGVAASVPVALLVAAILLGNDLRDLESDRAAGIHTLATILGRAEGWKVYVAMLSTAYAFLLAAVAARALPWPAVLALASVPVAARTVAQGAAGRTGLERLDQDTAAVHLIFGLLLTVGVGAWGLVN